MRQKPTSRVRSASRQRAKSAARMIVAGTPMLATVSILPMLAQNSPSWTTDA